MYYSAIIGRNKIVKCTNIGYTTPTQRGEL